MAKKLLTSLFLTFLVLHLSSPEADASLVTIDQEGKIILNVLSSNDAIGLTTEPKDDIEITHIPTSVENDPLVVLSTQGGKTNLDIVDEEGIKHLDVTDYQDEIIEIKQQSPAQNISIYLQDGMFAIKQNQITALTKYSISVNPKSDELTLKTPSGMKFLSVLPIEAIKSAIRSKVISGGIKDNKIVIEEQPTGELAYLISGKKEINIIKLIGFEIDVVTRVSAQTGELISIDDPPWLKALAFLFV